MNNLPIGIFDSGIGGLSIWKEINQLMPFESSIYIADSKNAPYGNRSQQEITDLSIHNTEFLINQGCKIIVVACNTATTNAIQYLRNNFNIPFIGIEPATKPAAIQTKTGKIGILATRGTLVSELFLNTSSTFRGNVEIIETIGKGLVTIIESGDIAKAKPLLEEYLTPMVEAGVDNIVLGCTHYPFLKPIIEKIIEPSISIIDSGNAVALQTRKILKENNLLQGENKINTANHIFYSSGNTKILEDFVTRINASNHRIKMF